MAIGATKSDLASTKLAVAEAALQKLKSHQAVNTSQREVNAAFKRFGPKLSVETLISLFKATFSQGDDDLRVTTDVVKELIRRGNVDAQASLVKTLLGALKKIDAGHREWGKTAYDQLCDGLLAKLEPAPLAAFVLGCADDILAEDGLTNVFGPALKKKGAEKKLLGKLAKVLARLDDAQRKKLLAALRKTKPSATVAEFIAENTKAASSAVDIEAILRSKDLVAVERLMLSLGSKDVDAQLRRHPKPYLLLSLAVGHPLSEAALLKYYAFVAKHKEGIKSEAAVRLAENNPAALERLVAEAAEPFRARLIESIDSAIIESLAAGRSGALIDGLRKARGGEGGGSATENGQVLVELMRGENSPRGRQLVPLKVIAFLESIDRASLRAADAEEHVLATFRARTWSETITEADVQAPLRLLEPAIWAKLQLEKWHGDPLTEPPYRLLSLLAMLAVVEGRAGAIDEHVSAALGKKLDFDAFDRIFDATVGNDSNNGEEQFVAQATELLKR